MQKQCLNDNCYNVTKQLAKTQQFLANISQYIEDANKANNSRVAQVWQTIQTDEEKHAELLHELLATEVKNNRF